MLLARYRYEQRKSKKSDAPLEALTLVTTAERQKAEAAGAKLGQTMAAAAMLARDLANAPAMELPAKRMAEIAEEVARARAHGRGLRQGGLDWLRWHSRRERRRHGAAAPWSSSPTSRSREG